ncbi:MAG: hypothetical protein BZY86_06410 [SAR202 cluster bacterium MP-NPac-SRR3961935-G1]|nr:MAG: hypothetical protein BZY84_09405 [SAR202 cluster bacterium MP-SInd-SRR3963457-G1]PKB84675.1 MAG: hypothetical protein BZY86_06410 [SAR202 cluster bacterium MP-NPac-SRR3961935-G1]
MFLGGFVFDMEGAESKQLDIVVTTNSCPRYMLTTGEHAKSFAPIDGTIAVVNAKSTLTTEQLEDALDNLASIPTQTPLTTDRLAVGANISDYEDWPYKVIYATDGIAMPTLLKSIDAYYRNHPEIPSTRRPNLIHVAGKYSVLRILHENAETTCGKKIPKGTFFGQPDETDVYAIQHTLSVIQERALSAQFIVFEYWDILNKLPITMADDARYILPPE